MLIQYLPTTGNRALDDWAARICRQLEIVAGDISDVAYAASWNGVTTIAPSKNAVYDKIELLVSGVVSDVIYGAGWNGVTTIAPSKNTIYDKIELLISDVIYGAGWNGVTTIAPSKNAVYDKIQLLISNLAYAASWDGVTTIAPSKNAVYDKIELLISDVIYGAGWNGVTTIAPSKNAVYDKIETLKSSYVKVSDVKASGTNGGTFTAGAWRIRTLNTEDSDTDGICSLASNQITLAAGTYICHIIAPGQGVNRHKAILYNVTDSSTIILGTSKCSSNAGGGDSPSIITGKFTIGAGKALNVQHRCETTVADNGLGVACSFGNEVYTTAEFWKVV